MRFRNDNTQIYFMIIAFLFLIMYIRLLSSVVS